MSKAAALDADEAVSAGSVFRTVFDEQRRMRIAVQVNSMVGVIVFSMVYRYRYSTGTVVVL